MNWMVWHISHDAMIVNRKLLNDLLTILSYISHDKVSLSTLKPSMAVVLQIVNTSTINSFCHIRVHFHLSLEPFSFSRVYTSSGANLPPKCFSETAR